MMDPAAPLTPAQQRLWELEGHETAPSPHTFALAYTLHGALDVERLQAAVRAVVSRHAVLRAVVTATEQGPEFRESPGDWNLEILDLPASTGEEALEETLRREAAAPLNPAEGPGWALRVFRRSPEEHYLLLHMHHLISDRWSVAVFMKHLAEAYREPARDAGTAETFASFAAYQAAVETPEPADVAYWRDLFASPAQALSLPSAKGSSADYRGHHRESAWPEALSQGLKSFAEDEATTLFPVLLAAFASLLSLRTGQEELIVCTPVIGRHRSHTRHRIGYFNNILPLRINLAGAPGFSEILERTKRLSRDAFTHQNVWYQTIASMPGTVGLRLSRCMFAVQNIPGLVPHLPGITCTVRDVPNGASNFDLSLFLEPKDKRLHVNLDYKTSVLTDSAAEALLKDFRIVVEALVKNPSGSPAALDLGGPWVEPAGSATGETTFHPIRPVSVLEERLLVMWRQLFPGETVTPDSDFFALGGDSLQAAKLLNWIEKEFACHLPMATLMEASTIRALGDRMADRDWLMPWESLIPIRTEGSRPPLFCVHGGGGNVFSYRVLAGHLEPDQPVYGLQARGLMPGDRPMDSVEGMAALYLEAISRVDPQGPYYLSGHSLGAVVAYEMAQRLVAAGKHVALLALLDHPGPGISLTRRDWVRYHLLNLSMLHGRDRWNYLWRGMVWRFNLGQAKRSLKHREAEPADAAGSPAVNVLEASMRAIYNYRIEPYPGKLTLFRAGMGSPRILSDPSGGWGNVAGGGVDTHDVPGTHMSMFRDPHVGDLGRALSGVLQHAQSGSAPSA